jgi:hypothetical protein
MGGDIIGVTPIAVFTILSDVLSRSNPHRKSLSLLRQAQERGRETLS